MCIFGAFIPKASNAASPRPIDAGTPTPLAPDQVRIEPLAEAEVDGRMMPVEWRVEIPDFGLAVDTEPLNARSWMGTAFPYWEGPIRFQGSHEGRGYLEMTGW